MDNRATRETDTLSAEQWRVHEKVKGDWGKDLSVRIQAMVI